MLVKIKRNKFFILLLVINIIIIVFLRQQKPNEICSISDVSKKIKSFVSNKCNIGDKYLIFECRRHCGGWADRLKGIISAYIWARITKRKFFINIKHPCELTQMLEANETPWNESVDDLFQCKDEPRFFYLNKVSNSKFHQLLQHIDIKLYKSDVDVLVVHNNLDWIKSFSRNQNLQEDISKLGYKQHDFKLAYLFRDVYNKLFKLTPRLQKQFDEFKQRAKPTNSTQLVCVQVRIGGRRPNVEFDKQFTERNNSLLYWEFVKTTFLKQLRDYKIFITTDTESVEQEAIKIFGKENVVTNAGPFTHIDRENIISKKNCSRVEKTILDFHSLKLCDMALISESGFGILGILNREDPIKNLYQFVNNNVKNSIKKYLFKKITNLSVFDE